MRIQLSIGRPRHSQRIFQDNVVALNWFQVKDNNTLLPTECTLVLGDQNSSRESFRTFSGSKVYQEFAPNQATNSISINVTLFAVNYANKVSQLVICSDEDK